MAAFVCFDNRGYAMERESFQSFSILETNLVYQGWGIHFADAEDPLNSEKTVDPGMEVMKKDPKKAGLMGGLVGFGSGQYYSKRWISGTVFLATDSFLTFFLIPGIMASLESPDDFAEAMGKAAGLALVVTCGIGLAVTHTIQAIWGPLAAKKYNKKLEQTTRTWQPFLVPGERSVRFGVAYRY